MFKKGAAFFAGLLLIASMTFAVGAMTNTEKVQSIVDEANAKIAGEVLKAQESSKNDVTELVEKTDRIAEKAIEQSEKFGGKVVCEDCLYYVDGVWVQIDPLKVAY